jgi:hypothetical protein
MYEYKYDICMYVCMYVEDGIKMDLREIGCGQCGMDSPGSG